jgi:hypothetical protein
MKAYVKMIDDLPFIIRVILALPGIDGIVYGLYRIGKGKLIAGLIWIFVGTVITWILDLYSLFTEGKVTFFV